MTIQPNHYTNSDMSQLKAYMFTVIGILATCIAFTIMDDFLQIINIILLESNMTITWGPYGPYFWLPCMELICFFGTYPLGPKRFAYIGAMYIVGPILAPYKITWGTLGSCMG